MQEFIHWLLSVLALPEFGLPSVFVVCTVSATLLPLGSEPFVFGYIKLNPGLFWAAILVATAGNTLGGMINYWMAYGAHEAFARDRHAPRALRWLNRLGPRALFFSFLPGIGDPLTAMAGWLKMPWRACLAWQMAGKFVRYLLATILLLWVPDSFWTGLFGSLKPLLIGG
jgi:membrane protein YqaA with SNARE-associated domain